ncbi:MAG TPA: shikimate dehydrogenase [Terracidiphilus sp.]|jgi:3-dehydroquinate dehydratase/shikimate dehydrogenase|nr:shikimate dehydrogenase [Terracidiphilus sp.]
MPHVTAIAALLPASANLRMRVGKVCIAIQAGSPGELVQRAEVGLKDSRFFEFRLDTLPKPAAALPYLRQFLSERREVTAIATCRRKEHGGHFVGTLQAELAILSDAAMAGCQMIDLEVESAEQAKPAQIAKLRSAGAALLISFHDFTRTRSLEQVADRIERLKPDYVKVVSTARSLSDNLAILRLIEDRSLSAHVVGIAMGEEGIVSRVLGPRAGAAFTFAALSDGIETAAGQMSAHTLLDLYRVEHLDQATRIFGVAGNPISHSLSPLMHNTAFRREVVNAVMLPLKARSLDDLLSVVRELPLAGVAVTMPLKEEVLPHLANMDPLTAKIGACNTLRTGADGKLYGFNTDVVGVVRPLEKRLRLKGARVAVLGAGGAARAAVFGLVDQGAEVFVVNRTHEHAVTLARQAKAKSLKHEVFAKQHFDVLINATPCGMKGVKQALPIAENELNASIVFDMVYNPLETPLLKLARSKGSHVVSGLEMFVQQGARQFEIWTGKAAPESEMLRVVEHELRRRG